MDRSTGVVAAVLAMLVLAAAACGSSAEFAEEAPTPEPTAVPTATLVPEPTATPEPTPTPTPVPPTPVECVAELPVRVRLAQLLMPLVVQADLAAATAVAAAGELGGVTLLGSPDGGLAAALAELQAASDIPVIVSVDEEGGRVQRLAALLGALPSAASLVASGTPEDAYEIHLTHAEAMAEVGITMSLAPVVDVGGADPIGDRSFGDDPVVVADYAAAVGDAIADAGLTPVIKHFPGHGRASADSHVTVAVTPPIEELRELDLVPYEVLGRSAAAVMVGHLDIPGLTDTVPASLSSFAVDGLLRTELGFDGLVITDAIDMGAVAQRWPTTEATELALLAGVDLVILGSLADVPPVLDHLEAAVVDGRLTDEQVDDSVLRVLDVKAVDPCELV